MNSDTNHSQDSDQQPAQKKRVDLAASTIGHGADESVLETLSPNEIDFLERILEEFAEQAPVADPGRLVDFLPEEASSPSFLLVELIKLDMAAAAESGSVPRIERYVQAMPKHVVG